MSRAQGGITLGPERGELDADFWYGLAASPTFYPSLKKVETYSVSFKERHKQFLLPFLTNVVNITFSVVRDCGGYSLLPQSKRGLFSSASASILPPCYFPKLQLGLHLLSASYALQNANQYIHLPPPSDDRTLKEGCLPKRQLRKRRSY
jgi:hypothetical protein